MKSAALILVLLAAAPALAQEQRASIEGIVRDGSAAAVPGVTVTARSPALVGVQTTTTDATGGYRFPALVPGIYEVTAELQGFRPAKAANVRLELGQILKIDLTMAVGGVAETVQVRGDAPLIDVKQNAAGANVQREIIDRIPAARDFTTLATSAPGITDESRNRGIQIDGASGADNRFVVDGVDTTDLRFGTSGKTVAPDFVQEVQVKASGYNAEYRAAIGGVVSAITKSGGNQFHGSLGTYFSANNLQGDVRPTLRLNPANQTLSEYVTVPADSFATHDPIGDLGGPLLRDRLWFYVGYNRRSTRTERTVTFRSNQVRDTFVSDPLDNIVHYNVTSQLTNAVRAKFAAANQRSRGGRTLPGIEVDGTSTSNPALFPSPTRTDSFNDSYSGIIDWIANNQTYVNVTTTYFTYGSKDVGNFSDALRHTFQASNFQFAEIPEALRKVSGFADNPSTSRLVKDDLARFNLNADVTRYARWRGEHSIKAGIQFEQLGNEVIRGAQAPEIQLFWDASLATNDGRRVRGTYGYYNVTRGVITEGDIHARNIGLFVQDAWTVHNRLTLNLGIRAEREEVPSYRPENPGVEFGFSDKVAPRIGFAWDVKGDSSLKAYGSWGVFHDLMKLTIGRVMFGAERWMNYRFTLDTFDWPSIQCGYPPVSGASCPGTFIESFDFRPVANDPSFNVVDPDLKPIRSQELTFGLDRELSDTMSLGVRYAHKWVDRAIEAVCFFGGGGEICGVNNPGFGPAEYPLGRDLPAQPKAERLYDGFEVRLRKRLADRWSLDTSYLLSHLRGNWSGIASSDEAVGSLQPNAGRAFDLLYYSFDAQGRSTNGTLGTDRPHQFKLQGTYDTPWGTMVGVNYIAESGLPRSTVINQRNIGFFPYGRGDMGRMPSYSQTDLLLQHQLRITRGVRITLGANVLNLFDQKTPTAFNVTPYRDQMNLSDAEFFGGFDPAEVAARLNFRPDPRYGLASGYQTRRNLRLQAKITF